jgi:hypothetical protein
MAANPKDLLDQDEDDDSPISKDVTNEFTPPEDTDDGGVIVKIRPDVDDSPTADEDDFYHNLVEDLDETNPGAVDRLGLDLLEYIERDKDSRKDRDEKYAEGIKRTGLGDEAPGGEAFEGASKAVHPMMTKATVYYQSHTIGEIFPSQGPVKDDIVGTVTPQRVEKAKRKCAHMNWQFKRQMPDFRNQLEKLLSQHPLGGSMYMRLVYDSVKKRPVPQFFSIDDVYIPDGAADFYSCERRTVRTVITQAEFDNRVRSGYYVKPSSISPPAQRTGDESAAEKAQDKVQGVERDTYNKDGNRTIFIVEALAVIEDVDDIKIAGDRPKMEDVEEDSADPLPYLIELDAHSHEIMRITRNWEEEDEKAENMCWLVDFEFIPWEGAQSVGLIHLAGSLSGAATGSLRALLDAALVNNLQTGVKLKGSGMSGQSLQLNIGQLTEVEGGVGAKDIREVVMGLPFNPPSQMLYQLLSWVTDQGEELIRTTFENLSQNGAANMPVGTTLALIEQGLKVLSAIHLRLHHAMDRLIGVLHRINRLYITDDDILNDAGELLAYRTDYEGPLDIVPVSDPEVFSDIQRFAQLQIVQQRSDAHPELYDQHKVEQLILQRTKIPNAVSLLRPQPQITEMNQVNENLAMALGRPVAAFPEQDHLAHIQVLLDFYQCPVLGGLPMIASKFTAPAMTHLCEHVVYWYLTQMVEVTSHAAGADVGKIAKIHNKVKDVSVEMDRALAAASKVVMQRAQQAFGQLPQIMQQAMQQLQQMNQPPPSQQPPDPTAIAVSKDRSQDVQAKIASSEKIEGMRQQGDQGKVQKQSDTTLQQTQVEQAGENERMQEEIASHERINAEDNATALDIASTRVQSGQSPGNIRTGTGLMGHSGPEAGGFGK